VELLVLYCSDSIETKACRFSPPALQYLLLSVRVGLVYMQQPIPTHHPMKEQQEKKRIKKNLSGFFLSILAL
jgi:hypothetical protein